MFEKIQDSGLEKILYVQKFKDIDQSIFGKDLQRISSKCPPTYGRHKMMEAFIETLNPMSYLFLIPDTVFTLVSVSASTFLYASFGFLATIILVGFVYGVSNYKELQHIEDKTRKQFKLVALQQACVDILLARNKKKVPLLSHAMKPEKEERKKWHKAKVTLGTATLVGSILFYTYYAITLAISAVFASSEFALMIIAPSAVGVALTASLVFGVLAGLGQYYRYTEEEAVIHAKKTETKQLQQKIAAYEAITKPTATAMVASDSKEWVKERNNPYPTSIPLHGGLLHGNRTSGSSGGDNKKPAQEGPPVGVHL